MQSVLAIANQKGGVGKTTSAAALGTVLSRRGRRVHLIDADPQADLTSAFGQKDPQGRLFTALAEQNPLPLIELTEQLSLTPSSIDLTRGEANFMAEHGREFLLQNSLQKTDLPDDTLVIIDCPPSLGLLTVNCLAAADKLLVTVHPGGFELRALVHLQQTVEQLHKRINPKLDLTGVLLTIVDRRKSISAVIERELKQRYKVFGVIGGDTRLEYAVGQGNILDLFTSRALDEYDRAADEIEQLLWAKATSAA